MFFISIQTNFIQGQCNFSQGPIGELCSSAIYICGSDLDGFSSTLPDSLSATPTWPVLCGGNGTADNILWFSFTPCSNKVTIEITPSNCTVVSNIYKGIQAGMFTKCDVNHSVACTDHTGGDGIITPITLTSSDFMPGDIGYFFIDGYAGSVCEFKIRVIEGIDTSPVQSPDPSILDDGFITGDNIISCNEVHTIQKYNLTVPECQVNYNAACGQTSINAADSICYVWNITPSSGRYFNNQDSLGLFSDIVFTKPGTYSISATGYFHPFYGGSCANAACGNIISWTVTVTGPDTISNTLINICPGNSFFYCGADISTDSVVYCTIDTCTVMKQEFKVSNDQLNLLGTKFICQGESFVFQGISYSINGSYEVRDQTDCTLLHRFQVETIDLNVDIPTVNTLLNCNNTSIPLTALGIASGPGSLMYSWKDISGNEIGLVNTLNVSSPGKYIVEVKYNATNSVCLATDEITITQDIKKPEVSAIKPVLKCRLPNDPASLLTVTTNDLLSFSEWTTPAGMKSTGMNIVVDSLNVATGLPYIFTAIGLNGCKLDTSFNISTNYAVAIVDVQGDDLTCFQPMSKLMLTSSLPWDSIRWERMDPDYRIFYNSNNSVNILTDTAGRYRANVMADTSHCWSYGEKEIENHKAYPLAMAGPDQYWYCNTTEVSVTPIANSGNEFQYFWGTNGGIILSGTEESKLLAGGPGIYLLNVFDKDSGCQSNDTIQIFQEKNIPQAILWRADDIHCFGQNDGQIFIDTVEGGFEPYIFTINGLKMDSTVIANLSPGSYLIEVKDKHGCPVSISVEIYEPPLFEIDVTEEFSIAFSDILDIDFDSNYPDDQISEIKWTNSKGEIIGNDFILTFSSFDSDVVDLEVITEKGCISRSKIVINVENELNIFFPNIFSPNGDNSNDRFIIWKNKVPANIDRLCIYDRFGNKVYDQQNFEFDNNPLGWDGTFNNQQVETGVYVYVVEYTDYTGIKHIIKKDLTLIR
ncbi:MAG: gliding motility-associated C-terminal domain-containing protein [Saprospiraceae bacterium]|nr:gliding motility-associated C-terminal domain-containing protein [Saprospiraceae bacterium]